MNRSIVRAVSCGLGALALALAGYALASNMGFRISYSLLGPGDSLSGTNWVALPFKPKPGLVTASDLYADLGGAGSVVSIARHDPATDTYLVYAGGTANDFPLPTGRGVVVTMASTLSYALTGSHDPRISVTLLGPEDSASGTNLYAPPYHALATTAGALIQELGGSGTVVNVTRFVRTTDALVSYNGSSGQDFPLVPGESYQIRVQRTTRFVPKVAY
jgi:hypothetical protein